MLSSFSLPPSFLSNPNAYLFSLLFVAHESSVPFVSYHHRSSGLVLGVTWVFIVELAVYGEHKKQ